MRGAGVCVAVALLATRAHAEDASSLRAEGEDFAKRGLYAEAIEKFKAADRLEPRAQHACMIGLAYLRRDIWAQAELFLARCKQRSRSGEPLPEWVEDADKQLADGLANANVSTVNIVVKPATAAASVRISGFAPDETFDPQTMHLPAGTYTLTISSSGFPSVEKKLELAGTHDTVDVLVDFDAPPPDPVELGVELSKVPRPRRGTPWLVTGGVLAAFGVGFHIYAAVVRERLKTTRDEYFENETRFDVSRAGAIIGYSAAAVTLGIGLYLRYRDPDNGAILIGAIASDSAYVGVEWRR
jgi:hypothetical protein